MSALKQLHTQLSNADYVFLSL